MNSKVCLRREFALKNLKARLKLIELLICMVWVEKIPCDYNA
jgi:hypothetical protein